MFQQTKTKPAGNKASSSSTARVWRINVRALIGLAVVLVLGLILGVVAWALQTSGKRSTLLTQAKNLAANKNDDLALSYLKEYLANNPNDLEALDLRGEILFRSARTPDQLGAIVKNGEQLLRLDPDVTKPRGQAVRRRLTETYLTLGPLLPTRDRKYGTAEGLARELVAQTKTAADLRLHAQTLHRLGTAGDRDKYLLAARRYEEARKLDPGDSGGSDSLARLYQFELKATAKATAVLDDLISAPPSPPKPPDATAKKTTETETAAEAASRVAQERATRYLTVAKFYADFATEAGGSGRSSEIPAARARAESMVKKAVELAPKDRAVRLAAAEIAIANKRPAEAAAHLSQVAEKDRTDFRYRTLEGIVALYDNKAADAIESWSTGLKITSGGDAELSWRLAFVLLQLGRVDEAEPLISQFRRNVGLMADGDVPPSARYLESLKFLKSNRPIDAIAELERARLKVPPGLKPQFHYTLGLALEATRDETRAMEEYRQAILADPKLAAPRLARSRLLQDRKLDDAIDELKSGLAEAEDVSLVTALARLELRQQLRLPKEKRSWAAIDALLERGRKIGPGNSTLAIVQAEVLAAQGNPEAASDRLGQAIALDKTDPELWIAHARKLVELGRPDRALTVLDQAMDPKAAGDQAVLRILRSRVLTAQGHGAEARDSLVRDLDRVRPDQRPQLWMALGDLYTNQNNPASARKSLAEWAKLLPDDPLPRLFVLELSLADNSDEAEAMAKDCIAALQRIGGSYYKIGQAAYLLRDRSRGKEKETAKARTARLFDAERLIVQIEKEAPNQRFAYLLRGALEQQRDVPAKAAEAYEKALKTDGGLAVLPRLIKLYGDMGKAGEAGLNRLRLAYPNAAPVIARAGAENAARLGNKELAEELARQVVEGAGESLDARVWQAKILNTLGKPQEAEKALRDLIAKQPADLGPWLALMYFQVSLKDQAAVVKTIETMITQVKNVERPELVWAQAWRVAGERDRADSAFDAALSRWPDDPRVGRAAAEYYEITGRREKAVTVLRDVLKRDEAQRWAARGLALILSARAGDIPAWRKAWELVKDPAPGGDLPEDRLIRALVLARGTEAANRDEAVKMLKKLVDDLPGDLPVAVTSRQVLARLLLKTEPALAAEFAAPDAMVPNASPAALTLHTDALIAAKKFDDADRQLNRLAAIAPEDSATVTLRARLLRALGQGTQAAEALERSAAEKIAGPNGEIAGRLIVQTLLVELNQPSPAERVAKTLLTKFPKSGGVLAAVVARQGRRQEALDLYAGVISDGDPANVREAARNALALITRDKFDPASIAMAEKVIDDARKKDPTSSDLLAMAGYLRHFQNRYEDEIKIYEVALAGQPEDFNLMNNMAWTLSEGLHKPEQALERINDAIRKSLIVPPNFYDTRGVIYTRLGKYKEAITDLKMAVQDRPTGQIWAHLARAYYKANLMDDFKKARDNAKNATPPLTPDMLEKADRAELEPLIFGDK